MLKFVELTKYNFNFVCNKWVQVQHNVPLFFHIIHPQLGATIVNICRKKTGKGN